MLLTHTPLDLQSTVREMGRLASQYSVDVVREHWRTVEEVYRNVQRVPFRSDETAPECGGAIECVKRPGYTLLYGGDCDDKTVLAAAALNLLGVRWRIVTVSYRPGPMSHVYLEIFRSGSWLPFDPTTSTLPIFTERPFYQKILWE